MRNLFLLMIFNNILFAAKAQQIFLTSVFNNSLEISYLACQKDKILLLTEKCKHLYYLDEAGNIIGEQSIDKGYIKNKEVEIEGAAWLKNGLLITNEKVGEILYLNFSVGTVSKVDANYDMSSDTGSQGMEGIAIDSTRRLCYVLKEKSDHNESMIRVFSILEGQGAPRLQFVKNVRIRLLNNEWRFADAFYNTADDQLYFLETKKRGYRVVKVKSSDLEKATGENLVNPILHKDLSGLINPFEQKKFNTNIEGLALKDGSIYMVSDNATTSTCSSSILGKGKTLLIKVPF
ncbi:esterase-like activity of phytase family protein [Dyadobacter fermentans]|uniref:esterase-like activity of phytase family protein n=1 Tax=Dyadobacter fermentans TaxID=94254 RepID=UPI001CBB5444|nr:esterase-like activity of phytase family protein [Dyadobacter fermentans]MBZ1362751.1 esterase-like activity of phytase family protein [Dyadobacter fermentans]